MPYHPTTPPEDSDQVLTSYLIRELRRIGAQFEVVDSIQLPVLHNPPEKPRDGMIVLADGTNWNPGSGAGFYGRSAGAWVFLG